MFRRRRRDESAGDQPDDATRDELATEADEPAGGKPPRPEGPFDASEVDLDQARTTRIDLGGLLVQGLPGMKLQLQVDQRTGTATAALFALDDAAVELMAVAAPRSSGWWEQHVEQIAADARTRGGTAEQARGPFGTEVRLVVPMTTPDGKKGFQPSRVSGIDGPRWMLRARFLGKAVSDAAVLKTLVDVVQNTIVVRGDAPMAPGDVIVLKAPSTDDLEGPSAEQAPSPDDPGAS